MTLTPKGEEVQEDDDHIDVLKDNETSTSSPTVSGAKAGKTSRTGDVEDLSGEQSRLDVRVADVALRVETAPLAAPASPDSLYARPGLPAAHLPPPVLPGLLPLNLPLSRLTVASHHSHPTTAAAAAAAAASLSVATASFWDNVHKNSSFGLTPRLSS